MGGYPGGYDNPNVYGPPVTYAPGYGTPPANGFQNGGLSGGGFSGGGFSGGGSLFGGGGGFSGGGPQFPGSAFPSSGPSTLFPGGILPRDIFSRFSSSNPNYSAYRLLQGPRLRHTYVMGLGGSDPDNLSTNDTDASVVFAFPNFMYGNQPLYVVPSFSLHQWEGPISTPNSALTGDLPANAYSGFLDVGWQSDPNQMFGTELGVRVGAFTDFNTWNSDSFRVLGKALAHFRLSPASTLKFGAYYLDRNKVKLLPAGGILWQPNPYTRFDIFFPQPKIARYWRTVGTRDIWWYLAGDYGGGSWTVRRRDRTEDSVDINELRAMFGLEWGSTDFIRAGRRSAFMEIGYAFDREVEYRARPLDNFKPDDGIVFRLGIGY